MQTVFVGLGILAAIIGLCFVLNLAGLASFSFFAPKAEQVRYNTFKESQAYNDGVIRELYAYRIQYDQANPGQKMAMRGAIMHEVSTYPKERLPAELQQFVTRVEMEGNAK